MPSLSGGIAIMSEYQLILVAIVVVLIGVAVYLHLPPRRPESQDYASTDRSYTDAAYPDDDRHWLGGFIYNNPDDPNVLVPKRYGLGWTINFGHPGGRALMIGLLLLILVLIFAGPLILPGSWGPTGYHPTRGGLLP